MARLEETSISCGVGSIEGLHGSAEIMITEVAEDMYCGDREETAFLLFSDTVTSKYAKKHGGTLLEAGIKKHKLGTVVKSRTKKNPNSGNSIAVWVWEVNRAALKKWYKKYGDQNHYERW